MIYKLLTISFFLLLNTFSGNLAAQKVKQVKNITAVAYHDSDLSKAKKKALEKAFEEALRKAGVVKNIGKYIEMYNFQHDSTSNHVFTERKFSEIRGAISDWEIVNSDWKKTPEGFIQASVTINATVLKYNHETDPTFDAKIEGLEQFYKNRSLLKFSVTSAKKSYLRVFVFGENEAFGLFPNAMEKNFLFQAKKKYEFPIKELDYELTTNKKSELHRIFFVFLKEDISYMGMVNYKDIMKWIFSISPDKRCVKTFSFTVVGKNSVQDF